MTKKKTFPYSKETKKWATNLWDQVICGSQNVLLLQKLAQFRRHPDWGAAFKKISPQFHRKQADGQTYILHDDLPQLFDVVDQEFIDQIIRNEPGQAMAEETMV